jgi:hypothetical protein
MLSLPAFSSAAPTGGALDVSVPPGGLANRLFGSEFFVRVPDQGLTLLAPCGSGQVTAIGRLNNHLSQGLFALPGTDFDLNLGETPGFATDFHGE